MQAMRTLSWVFVLLTLIIYIFAILVKQTIPFEEMKDEPDFHVDFRFGSVARCMWTLFELVTLEGWTGIADPLVKHSPTWAIFFIVFIMGLHYGLLNLVVAIIVESTMETAKGQEETMKKLEDPVWCFTGWEGIESSSILRTVLVLGVCSTWGPSGWVLARSSFLPPSPGSSWLLAGFLLSPLLCAPGSLPQGRCAVRMEWMRATHDNDTACRVLADQTTSSPTCLLYEAVHATRCLGPSGLDPVIRHGFAAV